MNKAINKYLKYITLTAPVVISILAFAIIIFIVIIPQVEESVIEQRKEGAKDIVNAAIYFMEYNNDLVNKGQISLKDAQDQVIEVIRHIRYGHEFKDYFWINDMHPTMIMHPYRLELEGRDLSNYTDAKGKKLFVEMVKVVEDSGEGFVDYMWQWKDDYLLISPKISFVHEFKPWGWIIGTGIYTENIKAEIKVIERNILRLFAGIVIIVLLLQILSIYLYIKIEHRRAQSTNELSNKENHYKVPV